MRGVLGDVGTLAAGSAVNAAATMRSLLAQQGIYLDEPRAPAPAPAKERLESVEPIDRAAISEVLLERGAPLRDVEWLSASCPSMDDALAFEPTAWMRRDTDDLQDPAEDGKGRP